MTSDPISRCSYPRVLLHVVISPMVEHDGILDPGQLVGSRPPFPDASTPARGLPFPILFVAINLFSLAFRIGHLNLPRVRVLGSFFAHIMDSDAIPPSSPPHATTANFPSSPFFEPRNGAFSRKSSSPPPLFSSDDSRESIDVTNYESPRIFKNKRKGAWWDNGESIHNTPEAKKTKMSRNYDSGVYMLSDATDSSEDLLPHHKSPFPFGLDGSCDAPTLTSAEKNTFDEQIRVGLEKNQETYEFRGSSLEDDDIEQIGELASVIRNVADPGRHLPVEGQYRSMLPELYVDLSQNKLCRLTSSLFDVQHLTTLLLRNNEIEELPQAIGRLRNLRALDVSLNKLTHLPFDILKLLKPHGSLERLHTMGNQLLEPMTPRRMAAAGYTSIPSTTAFFDSQALLRIARSELSVQLADSRSHLAVSPDTEATVWRIRHLESCIDPFGGGHQARRDAEAETGCLEHHPPLHGPKVGLHAPRLIARTPVSYFDQAGHLLKHSPAPPSSNDQSYARIVKTNDGTYGIPSVWFEPPSASRVPSLLTSSIHNALKKRHHDDFSVGDIQQMLPDPVPHDINAIFSRALDNDVGGYGEFRQCHTCNKDYVVTRAEWTEFWSTGIDRFHPLNVKVCSWACVPAEAAKRPQKLLTW